VSAGGTSGGKAGNGGAAPKPPAGGTSGSSNDDSGCGCSVPRSSNHGALGLALAGALVAFARRRSSRRRG
jgi:hypothetical protein